VYQNNSTTPTMLRRFCSTLSSDCKLVAIEEILHHYGTLNFKMSCLFPSKSHPLCFNLEDYSHISKTMQVKIQPPAPQYLGLHSPMFPDNKPVPLAPQKMV
jgi:hypothetical protein